MKELTIEASTQNIASVTAFVDAELEAAGCPIKVQMQFDIAIDELFGNIAQYAYPSQKGFSTIRVEIERDPLAAIVTFIDSGVPFNPLAKADPDINLPIEERKIGGLGIFMVKNSMDEVVYEYKFGKNILKIMKML